MKNKLLENIIACKPYFEENSEYIKSINLGIPIHIIDIIILKKEIEELPITYRIILKLVDNKIEQIVELSDILGMEQRIVEETLSEMSVQNLIYNIGSNIKITQKGKDTLEKMKLIKSKEDVLRNISINAITDEVSLNYIPYNTCSKINCSLKETQDINEENILARFDKINQLYQKEQIDLQKQLMGTKKFEIRAISELQDIISINKNTVKYDCKKIFIYYKDETVVCRICDMNSDEEEIYLNEIYNQYSINSNLLGVEFIREDRNSEPNYLIDKDELELNKKMLEEDIEKYQKNRSEENENKIFGKYYTNRFLLDEEYNALLLYELSSFKGKIYMQIRDFSSLIFNEEIFDTLKKIGRNKQEINIVCLKKNQKKYLEKIKELRKFNIDITEVEKIDDEIIIFDNKYAIISYSKIYKIKDKENYGIKKELQVMYVDQRLLDDLKKT